MIRKGGLGRGLDSLIPKSASGSTEIPVDQVRPNPHQPRQRIDPDELAELTASVREHGIIQPVVVTRAAEGDGFILIAGHRRWEAARQAGLERIPAVVKDASPREMLELALVENVQRSDLNPLEEAAAYRQLLDEFGLTQEAVAQRVGRSRPSVANTLRLLGLPEPVRDSVARGELTEGHARALLGAGGEARLLSMFREVTARGLNVRQTEELIRRRRSVEVEPAARTAIAPDPEARQIEALFREALGTRVELIRSGVGGRLVIHFYNSEQLEALYEVVAAGVGSRGSAVVWGEGTARRLGAEGRGDGEEND